MSVDTFVTVGYGSIVDCAEGIDPYEVDEALNYNPELVTVLNNSSNYFEVKDKKLLVFPKSGVLLNEDVRYSNDALFLLTMENCPEISEAEMREYLSVCEQLEVKDATLKPLILIQKW